MGNKHDEEVREEVRCACCNRLRYPERMYLVCYGCRDRATWKPWRRQTPFRVVLSRSIIVAAMIAGMIWVAMQ